MSSPQKKLALSLLIPIILVLCTLIAFLWPKFQHPFTENFLISAGDAYCLQPAYEINQNHLQKNPQFDPRCLGKRGVALYQYDAHSKTFNKITFRDAEHLSLNPAETSPQGFTVQIGQHDYQFITLLMLFHTHQSDLIYAVGHGVGYPLPLPKEFQEQFFGAAKFLGWIQ